MSKPVAGQNTNEPAPPPPKKKEKKKEKTKRGLLLPAEGPALGQAGACGGGVRGAPAPLQRGQAALQQAEDQLRGPDASDQTEATPGGRMGQGASGWRKPWVRFLTWRWWGGA